MVTLNHVPLFSAWDPVCERGINDTNLMPRQKILDIGPPGDDVGTIGAIQCVNYPT